MVVKVGAKKKNFNVHKHLLCKSAAYFKAALEGSFIEAKSQILELPEEKVAVFEHFVFWIYTDQVLQEGQTLDDISWHLLFHLYVFSEARGITILQNKVIDVLIDKSHYHGKIPTQYLNYIHGNTRESSPIRRLFVDWAAHEGTLNEVWFNEEDNSDYPKAFLIDLVCALYKLKHVDQATRRDFQISRSEYHVTPSA